MSPADREVFELRLIEDEPFSQAIESEEFDLIDDYATNALPHAERRQVEPWINASTQRRARVLTTQRLRHIQPARSTWRWWPLGVAAATACFVLLTITRTSRHSNTTPASAAKATSPAAPPQQDSILLAAVRQRSNTDSKPILYTVHPTNATRLQILLPLSAQNTAYTLQIQSVQTVANLRPQGPAEAPYIELILPPGTLHAEHYQVTLSSPSEHYELAFNVQLQ